jgi:hypothetical protein
LKQNEAEVVAVGMPLQILAFSSLWTAAVASMSYTLQAVCSDLQSLNSSCMMTAILISSCVFGWDFASSHDEQ